MWPRREVIIFLAGAQTFHALSHLWLGFSGLLPMQLKVPPMTFTKRFNLVAILINGGIAAWLLWWAATL